MPSVLVPYRPRVVSIWRMLRAVPKPCIGMRSGPHRGRPPGTDGRLQALAPKGPVAYAPLGVEDQWSVLADLVVWEISVVNQDHDQVCGTQLLGVATDAGERRHEIRVLGDMGVVHSHVGAEGMQLPRDDHRR